MRPFLLFLGRRFHLSLWSKNRGQAHPKSRRGLESFKFLQPFCFDENINGEIADVIIFPLNESAKEYVFAWDISGEKIVKTPEIGDVVLVEGYPDCQQEIDRFKSFDEFFAKFQTRSLQATVGSCDDYIITLDINPKHSLDSFNIGNDFDGFSGAPVYIKPPSNSKMRDLNIVGMAITGNPESNKMRIISIKGSSINKLNISCIFKPDHLFCFHDNFRDRVNPEICITKTLFKRA